jgi:hypothetical protein
MDRVGISYYPTSGAYQAIQGRIKAYGEDTSMEKLHNLQRVTRKLRLQGLYHSGVQADQGWTIGYKSVWLLITVSEDEYNSVWRLSVWDNPSCTSTK